MPQQCRSRGRGPPLSLRYEPRRQVRRNNEAATLMANIPKSKDATEEALSAIQEALNIRAPETRPGTPFEPVAETDAAAASTPPAGELFPQEAPPAGCPTGET